MNIKLELEIRNNYNSKEAEEIIKFIKDKKLDQFVLNKKYEENK